MSKSAFNYSIRSALAVHPENPVTLGAKFLSTLDALSDIESTIFAGWQVLDLANRSPLPLATARRCVGAIIESSVTRDDLYQGYDAMAYTDNLLGPRRISLHIKAGGNGRNYGNVSLRAGDFGFDPDPTIITYPVFRAALLAINAIWPSLWACAHAFRSNHVEVPEVYRDGVTGYRLVRTPMIPSEPTFPDSVFHIPWVAYLSARLALGVELPPEILTEHTPDNGLLMIATKERLEPANPEHLRRARILAETLITRTDHSSS
jgi:hypothetical protein